MNIDTIMAELAQYIRMQEEAAAMVESLKDQLKERMTALKKDLPEIAARYTKTTTARRFTFA